MKIITLTGCKMVGKSTVANAIADEYDGSAYILSFADPIRAMVSAMGIESKYLTDQRYKEEEIQGLNKSARYLMQTLGTEWGRGMVAQDIWLWAMSKKIEEAKAEGAGIVVIDDLRFENEAKWAKQVGAIVVRLLRDGYDYGNDSHSSEQPIPKQYIDFTQDAADEYQAATNILNYA